MGKKSKNIALIILVIVAISTLIFGCCYEPEITVYSEEAGGVEVKTAAKQDRNIENHNNYTVKVVVICRVPSGIYYSGATRKKDVFFLQPGEMKNVSFPSKYDYIIFKEGKEVAIIK